MGTVKKCDLSLMIRSLAGDEEYMEPGLVSREFHRDLLRSLDNPKVEYFSLVEKVVLITHTLAKSGSIVPRISGDDSVNEGAVYAASVLKPSFEPITKIPEIDILADALLEMLAVFENQLAREDNETLSHVALDVLVAMVKELN